MFGKIGRNASNQVSPERPGFLATCLGVRGLGFRVGNIGIIGYTYIYIYSIGYKRMMENKMEGLASGVGNIGIIRYTYIYIV